MVKLQSRSCQLLYVFLSKYWSYCCQILILCLVYAEDVLSITTFLPDVFDYDVEKARH